MSNFKVIKVEVLENAPAYTRANVTYFKGSVTNVVQAELHNTTRLVLPRKFEPTERFAIASAIKRAG